MAPFTSFQLLCAILCLGFALLVHISFRSLRERWRYLQTGDVGGKFVAECYLEWPICRGSTMFRGAFNTQEAARASALYHARILDSVLPTHYPAEYSSGRRYFEKYDFGIRWGVRDLTDQERVQGVTRIWTDEMPGTSGHKGEHSTSHPWESQTEFAGDLAGFKI